MHVRVSWRYTLRKFAYLYGSRNAITAYVHQLRSTGQQLFTSCTGRRKGQRGSKLLGPTLEKTAQARFKFGTDCVDLVADAAQLAEVITSVVSSPIEPQLPTDSLRERQLRQIIECLQAVRGVDFTYTTYQKFLLRGNVFTLFLIDNFWLVFLIIGNVNGLK